MNEDLVRVSEETLFDIRDSPIKGGKRIFVVNVIAAQIEWKAINCLGELRPPEVENDSLAALPDQELASIFQASPKG
jgi:hypothetical protein